MPLRSLSTRVAVPAGLVALVSVAMFAYVLIRIQRDEALHEIIRGSESISEAILLSLDHDMRDDRSDRVQEVVEAMGRHEGIERIRVFNKAGKVVYSSQPQDVGSVVDTRAEACSQCHKEGVTAAPPAPDLDPRHRSRIYTNGGGRRLLGTIFVIRNRTGCQGSNCHMPVAEQKVLGVLDVTSSLEPAWARLGEATRNAVLLSLAAASLITATLMLVIRRSVRRPLDRLVAASRLVATGGDLAGSSSRSTTPTSVRAARTQMALPDGTAREIRILAAAFNEMIESYASSNRGLEEWANSLQGMVASKARELTEARVQIVQAEKLSSVGLVAAGVAHELNSPLMAILTFAHLVRDSLPPGSHAIEDVGMIERETKRCATIIRQLLDYARQQEPDPARRPCRADTSLLGALELLKGELQNGRIAVSVSVAPDLADVEINDAQLMQVFVNLIVNAVHAMPEAGDLFIDASTVTVEEPPEVDPPLDSGAQMVRISLRDTGTGIPRENLDRIFDPFFTTKPVGKGSGLGLSVSLGIVRSFGGTILVDSDGESWTEFIVVLPACGPAAQAAAT